jgi:hypothetical protein
VSHREKLSLEMLSHCSQNLVEGSLAAANFRLPERLRLPATCGLIR